MTECSEPIACTLDAAAMPDRLTEWQALLALAASRSTTPSGALRIAFDEVDVRALSELALAEQRCCAFFAFAITVDARGIALEVQAPEDAGEIVTALFGSPAPTDAAR